MAKNNKKVITLSVPADIDDQFLDKIKDMLVNYKSSASAESATSEKPALTYKEHSFESEKEVRAFLFSIGFDDFKIPKHDLGIYYDEGLTIKKLENNWLVKISS